MSLGPTYSEFIYKDHSIVMSKFLLKFLLIEIIDSNVKNLAQLQIASAYKEQFLFHLYLV